MTTGGFGESGPERLHVLSAHVEQAAMPGLIALVAREGVTPTRGHRHQLVRGLRAVVPPCHLPDRLAEQAHRGGGGGNGPCRPGLLRLEIRWTSGCPNWPAEGSCAGSTVPWKTLCRRAVRSPSVTCSPSAWGSVASWEGRSRTRYGSPKRSWNSRPWDPLAPGGLHAGPAVRRLPLMHQPGERWMYNIGIHVVGALGMVDTSFSVPPDRLDRLITA